MQDASTADADDVNASDATPVADREAMSASVADGATVVAIAFREELLAQEALMACMRLQRNGRLTLDDAAIAIKVADDKIRLVQTKDVNAPQGAVSGSWWGLIGGLFVGGPLVGAALGAAIGGIWAKMRDVGIDDGEMRRVGETLDVGQAALFLLITDCHASHVLFEASRFPGRLLVSTLEDVTEQRLRDALSQTVNPWDD